MDRIGEGFCLDFDGRYCDLKMKEHHEQLLHTQLHVTDMLSRVGLEGVQKHLLCMFAQSGALLLFAGSGERSVGSVSGTEFLNDMEGLAPIESLMSLPKDESLGQWGLGKGGHTWTFSRIRHQMALFLMLFRMVELVRLAKLPRKDLPLHEIHEFHREAGMDKFYELSMRYDLPPGAVLVYMHMFSGTRSRTLESEWPKKERAQRGRAASEPVMAGPCPAAMAGQGGWVDPHWSLEDSSVEYKCGICFQIMEKPTSGSTLGSRCVPFAINRLLANLTAKRVRCKHAADARVGRETGCPWTG
jgi:hypothetical protein